MASGFKVWARASWRDDWQDIGVAETREAAAALLAGHIAKSATDHIEARIMPATGEYVLSHRRDRTDPWREVGRFGSHAEAAARIDGKSDAGDWLIRLIEPAPTAGM